ncbi:MAG: hypothetical protein R3B82_08045 [Sandaracinaceae bacterium]
MTDAAGRVLVEDTDEAVGASAVARATPTSEPFYGLGEKTGGLDRRGRRWTFWNTDAYDPAFGGYRPDQDPLYASIPFFVALREGVAYGVFTDVAYRLTIDLAAATPEVYRVESEGPAIDQYVILGPRMQDVLRTYTGLTGRAPIPPRWAPFRVPPVPLGLLARRARRGGRRRSWRRTSRLTRLSWTSSTWTASAASPSILSRSRIRKRLAARLEGQGFRGSPSRTRHCCRPRPVRLRPRARERRLPGRRPWTLLRGRGLAGSELVPRLHLARRGPCRRGRQPRRWRRRRVLDVNESTVFPESGGMAEIPNDLVAAGDGVPTTMAECNVYGAYEARATFEVACARRPVRAASCSRAPATRASSATRRCGPGRAEHVGEPAPTPAMLMGLGSRCLLRRSDGSIGHVSPELFAR